MHLKRFEQAPRFIIQVLDHGQVSGIVDAFVREFTGWLPFLHQVLLHDVAGGGAMGMHRLMGQIHEEGFLVILSQEADGLVGQRRH